MKRDLVLVRNILFRCEELEAGSTATRQYFSDLCAEPAILGEHLGLLAEAGLLHVIDVSDSTGDDYIVRKLTWAGHEFIDSIRDEGLWQKAKKHVLKPGASWTLEILKEWAKNEIKQKMGLPE